MSDTHIYVGDCLTVLRTLPDQCVNTCVTSPPYFGLRDYGMEGQLGLEPTPDEFVVALVQVFREVRRILRDDGTVWLNLGDSYAGNGKGAWDIPDDEKKRRGVKESYRPNKNPVVGRHTDASIERGAGKDRNYGLKNKDLIGIPWRVAFALQADGWYLRQDIIWNKPNPMPESIKDRCTKAHEYIFLLSKCPKYYFDYAAIEEPATWPEGPGNKRPTKAAQTGEKYFNTTTGIHKIGPRKTRRKRDVWTVQVKAFPGAHFATFPPELILPCILAGCPEGGVVLDPFGGTGTVGAVAESTGRNAVLVELNPEYADMAIERINNPKGKGPK